MFGPDQVLSDMDNKIPETVHPLHMSAINFERVVSFLLFPPEVHNHLLCLADIYGKVVVLALVCAVNIRTWVTCVFMTMCTCDLHNVQAYAIGNEDP